MAALTRDCLTRSLETGHRRKQFGGEERNSRESPKRTVDLTQASETVKSQRSANRDNRPPIASPLTLPGSPERTGPSPSKGASSGILRPLSNLEVLMSWSGRKAALRTVWDEGAPRGTKGRRPKGMRSEVCSPMKRRENFTVIFCLDEERVKWRAKELISCEWGGGESPLASHVCLPVTEP